MHDENIPPYGHQRLNATDPRVVALTREAARRGFLPYEQFNGPEGGILAQVVCRYCREGFDPYSRLLQREHVAAHRRQASKLLLLRTRGQRPRRDQRARQAARYEGGWVARRDVRRAARTGRAEPQVRR
jgi:hypothetical protein